MHHMGAGEGASGGVYNAGGESRKLDGNAASSCVVRRVDAVACTDVRCTAHDCRFCHYIASTFRRDYTQVTAYVCRVASNECCLQ